MNNFKIKNATAEYTGGGIYIYFGQLENGLYFRTADEWENISICKSDTSHEDADYPEFYEQFEIETITGAEYETFFNDIVIWIATNDPDGNYNIDELEKRMYETGREKEMNYYKNIIDFMKYLNDAISEMDVNFDKISKYTIELKCNDKEVTLEWGANEVNYLLSALEEIVADSDELWNATVTETTYDPHQDITFIWSNTYYHGELKAQELSGFYHGQPDDDATETYKNKLKATY